MVDPYAKQKGAEELERFKKPVCKLTIDELWEDVLFCGKKIGSIKAFPPGYTGEKPDPYKERFFELKQEITERILNGRPKFCE
jgi:hypothetical protein